jgi:hypothetical protein
MPRKSNKQENENPDAQKSRAFACVIYPDSAPEDWLKRLEDTFIPAIVSPLHDKDVNPDGTPKKAHYHVMIMYDGPRTLKQAKRLLSDVGAANGHAEVVNTVSGTARYFCHLDNPDKAQYNIKDVKELSGIDYLYLTNRDSDKLKILGDIQDFIDRNMVYSFAQLQRYAKAQEPTWYKLLSEKCGWNIKEYLKSVWWEDEQIFNAMGVPMAALKYVIVDKSTGETVADLRPKDDKQRKNVLYARPKFLDEEKDEEERKVDMETGEILDEKERND